MKKVFLGLFLILSFSQYSNGDAGFFGSPFGGYVIYDLNGGGLVVSRNWGSSIGTNPSSFSLKGGIIHTYKNNNNGGGNICGGTLYYRVWTGTQSGSFNSISLTFAANHSFNTTHTQGTDYSGGTGDQKWETNSSTIDLLSLAPSNGTWTIEMYFEATGEFNNNSGCSQTYTYNNSGSNYTLTFIRNNLSVTSVTSTGSQTFSDGMNINVTSFAGSNMTYSARSTTGIQSSDVTNISGTPERWSSLWTINNSSGVSTKTADFTFDFGDYGFGSTTLTGSDYVLVRRTAGSSSGTNWTTVSSSSSIAGDQVTFSGIAIAVANDEYALASTNINNSPLPVHLINLKATKFGQTAIIAWTTAAELDNDYFRIERQLPNGEFISIGTVKGAGTSNALLNYSFIDKSPRLNSVNFYQVVQHDFNGINEPFGPVPVKMDADFVNITTWPSPFENTLTISKPSEVILNKIVVANMLGKIIWEQTISEDDSNSSFNIKTDTWVKGHYFITLLGPEYYKTLSQVKF